jgi:hypothetical protein
MGKLVPQLPGVVTFSYDLHFSRVISHWKGCFEKYTLCHQKLTMSAIWLWQERTKKHCLGLQNGPRSTERCTGMKTSKIVQLENSCVLLQWLCTTGSECVSLDSNCVLLQWLCTTSGDFVSLDNSFVLLRWLCTTCSDCVSLDNNCVLLRWLYTIGSDCVSLEKYFCTTTVVVYH